MDKATSVLAALDAGKLPSHQQISQFIHWFNINIIPQATPQGQDQLSAQGRVLADDVRQVLEAYKQLGDNKNNDNLLQQSLWHLTEADLSSTSTNIVNTNEASTDIKKLKSAILTIVRIVWSNLSNESGALFDDFASFSRLALADAAELLESQAAKAKDTLRELDGEVQEGERDTVGRKKRRLEEEKDPKVAFAHGMDTIKDAGVSVIGTGQEAKASAERTADKASTRIRNSYYQICDRAQNDQEYHDSLITIFSTIQKWLTRSLDTAQDINKSTSLESFIDDPTPEQHVSNALRGLGTLLERLSGGKTLDDLYAKIRACVVDVRQDEELKGWCDGFFEHLRKSLDEPGYARSDEAKDRRKELRQRWQTLQDPSSPSGKQWKSHWDALKSEWDEFISRISNDGDLIRVREVHEKLGGDIERGLVEVGGEAEKGLQGVVQQVSWFWQDLGRVYVPRVLGILKDLPIPRTEYKDNETEFVLENFNLTSLKTDPAHIFIRNITDIDITTTSTSSQSAVGTLTRINVQAIQLKLDEVSFWYKDKKASVGPSEYTGLVGFKIPEKGVDVDLKIRMIPPGPDREKRRSVHRIEELSVHITDEVEMEVKESNHGVLMSVFKPIVQMRVKEVLERTLEEHMRGVIEWIGGVLWDVGKREEVFEDAGMNGGQAYMAAVWSEIGRWRKMSRGGGGGQWYVTGTGVVREEKDEKGRVQTTFAIGGEPQVLSGEKRGPLGTASEPLAKRVSEAVGEVTGHRMDVDVGKGVKDAKEGMQGAGEAARREAWKAKEGAKGVVEEGKQRVRGFWESVERKRGEEEGRRGWESGAFDLGG